MKRIPSVKILAAALAMTACSGAPANAPAASQVPATTAPAQGSSAPSVASTAPASVSSGAASASSAAAPASAPNIVEKCLKTANFCFYHADTLELTPVDNANGEQLRIIREGVDILRVQASESGPGAGCIPKPGAKEDSEITLAEPIKFGPLKDRDKTATVVQGVAYHDGKGYFPFTMLVADDKTKVGPAEYCALSNMAATGLTTLEGSRVTMGDPTSFTMSKETPFPTAAEAKAELAKRPHQAAKEILLTATRS